MIHITTVGGVTADIELKESTNGAPYLSFDLAVTKGYQKQYPFVQVQYGGHKNSYPSWGCLISNPAADGTAVGTV